MDKLTPNQAREAGARCGVIELLGGPRNIYLSADDRTSMDVALAMGNESQRRPLIQCEAIVCVTIRAFERPTISRNSDNGRRGLSWASGYISLYDSEVDLVAAWLDGWAGGGA